MKAPRPAPAHLMMNDLLQVSSVHLCLSVSVFAVQQERKRAPYRTFPGPINVKVMYVPVPSPFDVLSHSHSTDGLGHTKPAMRTHDLCTQGCVSVCCECVFDYF